LLSGKGRDVEMTIIIFYLLAIFISLYFAIPISVQHGILEVPLLLGCSLFHFGPCLIIGAMLFKKPRVAMLISAIGCIVIGIVLILKFKCR